jgi:hypothetical protein
MQTSEDYMKIWKMVETTGVECIKRYEEENKKDPLELEYKARVDFWNRYIEAQLAKVEFCCDRKYYYELRNKLIYQAQHVLEPIIKILGERKQFENVTFIIKVDRKKVEQDENKDI